MSHSSFASHASHSSFASHASHSSFASEVCVKLSTDDVVNILIHIDTLLVTNQVKLKELFNENDKLDLSRVKKIPQETEDLLYDYFINYSYGELSLWLKKNIGFFNSFKQHETLKKPEYIKKCSDTKTSIINSAAWLLKLLKTKKSENIKIIFTRDSELCDESIYKKLVDEFSLTNHLYYSDHIVDTFTLNIDIDKISIRMEIEGLDDLYIFSVSQVDFDIYFDDVDNQWPHNYQAKVLKYHDEDYIWINKSALKTNEDDIVFMLDCIMFACHFPTVQQVKSTVPTFKIKSILLNNSEIPIPKIKID